MSKQSAQTVEYHALHRYRYKNGQQTVIIKYHVTFFFSNSLTEQNIDPFILKIRRTLRIMYSVGSEASDIQSSSSEILRHTIEAN